jgi:hypothetical protein
LGLHASRQLSDKVLRSRLLLSRPLPRVCTHAHIEGTGGSRFLAASPCRHGGRTLSSPPCGGTGVKSLRVPTSFPRSAFPADCPHRAIVTALPRYARILGVPRIWPIFVKATFHLKRVIVTPAVYWSFVPLKRAFRYQHWAGFSGRTQPFDLAATYVLVKQSGLPSHCDQPLSRLAPFIPKVQGEFAEFPRVDFRRHALGFSPRGTCVSSRYGQAE